MFNRGIEVKTPDQIDDMRRAGVVVGETLALLRSSAAPGMTTKDLDRIAKDHILGSGATSNFLGYYGFTGVICSSVNEEIVHGIPGDRVLLEGDIVSLDCGAIINGWHGDAAITIPIGEVAEDIVELMRVCEESLWQGIAAAAVGGHIGDIGHAIETYIDSQGAYGNVDGYTGHGIGSEMHMDPSVPNVGKRGKGPRIRRGMALAIEPMITLHPGDTRTLDDDWTVVSADGSWASHFEHTLAFTDTGLWVLTALDGGKARLEELGLPFGGH
ncbi:type I methionyl aminopeptidase [soil metagenome]